MFKIDVSQRNFSNSRARLSNVRAIAEYSVTVDREVVNDRTHARYIIDENVKNNVEFDLKKGVHSFISKAELMLSENRLQSLCNWVCAQEETNLKELFGGAEFSSSRGTMQTIATTSLKHNPRNIKTENAWTIIAVKVGGVIMFCEITKSYDNVDLLGSYSGFKFEQYMTSDQPGGEPDTDAPVDNRAEFRNLVRSDLIFNGQSIPICCSAEVDAIRGETLIELKTRERGSNFSFFKYAMFFFK
ncbi:hypothetical protein PRIPAC_91695 [Pristionchus pacificus]|nr:hypothetical protein PRIPAC_91695 [Pristionchus pacificus]